MDKNDTNLPIPCSLIGKHKVFLLKGPSNIIYELKGTESEQINSAALHFSDFDVQLKKILVQYSTTYIL